MLFIATIEKAGIREKKRSQELKLDQIKLRPFLFILSTDSQQDVLKGIKMKDLPYYYLDMTNVLGLRLG